MPVAEPKSFQLVWRNTTIRNLDDDLGIIPNATLIEEIITNHHRPTEQTRVLVPLRVAPESDLSRVEEVSLEVAREVMAEVEGGVPTFEPFVRYGAFGALGTEFSVIMRTREYTQRYLVVHEFIKRLDERYRREGIEVRERSSRPRRAQSRQPDREGIHAQDAEHGDQQQTYGRRSPS